MTLSADPAERLSAPPRHANWRERPRFAGLLLLCLCLHTALFAYLLWQDMVSAPLLTQEQEIPVEVVTLPPEPTPTPQQQAEQQAPKPKEPPQPLKLEEEYEEPGVDAPRAASKETVERKSAREETRSPNVAPPKEQAAQEPENAKDAGGRQPTPQNQQTQEAASPKKPEESPDAEVVDLATPATEPKPDQTPAPAKTEVSPNEKAGSIADQIAALAPVPDFQFGAAAKPSPVSGGNAKTTYFSILYGLIVPRLQIPPSARKASREGLVAFYIDERGNLTHQAVVRSSGLSELDAAAVSAVRRAAPFPPPPYGHPRSILFRYSNR